MKSTGNLYVDQAAKYPVNIFQPKGLFHLAGIYSVPDWYGTCNNFFANIIFSYLMQILIHPSKLIIKTHSSL